MIGEYVVRGLLFHILNISILSQSCAACVMTDVLSKRLQES